MALIIDIAQDELKHKEYVLHCNTNDYLSIKLIMDKQLPILIDAAKKNLLNKIRTNDFLKMKAAQYELIRLQHMQQEFNKNS